MEVNAEYFLSTLALVVLLGDRVGGVNVAVLSQLAGGQLLALQPHLQIVPAGGGAREPEALHHLRYRASHAGVLAEGHSPSETIVETDEGLLEVERSVVPIEELCHVFEGDQKVDALPVLDGGCVLYHGHLGSGLDVSRETASEVEIKPAEIHFFEVFAIVHVTKEVNVCSPAYAVQTSLILHTDCWQNV